VHITFQRDGDASRLRRMIWAASRKNVRRIWVFAAIFVAVGVALLAIESADPFLGSLFLTIGAVYVILPWYAVARMARRVRPLFGDPAVYTITDEDVTVHNAAATLTFRWSGFGAVREVGEFWLCLNRAKVPAVIIPQECMSAGDQLALRTFLATRGVVPAEYRL
jgi:hypothetical protein